MNRYAPAALAFIFLFGGVTGCRDRPNESTGPGKEMVVSPDPPPIPPELQVNGSPILQVHASGVQIYILVQNPDGSEKWNLKAPEATFHGNGKQGRHYAGPTWECTNDGSKVVGRKLAEHAFGSSSVPWLVLEAKSHDGNGILTAVTIIQRIDTVGGTPPPTTGAKPGDEARVPYTADYVFYGAGATTRP